MWYKDLHTALLFIKFMRLNGSPRMKLTKRFNLYFVEEF